MQTFSGSNSCMHHLHGLTTSKVQTATPFSFRDFPWARICLSTQYQMLIKASLSSNSVPRSNLGYFQYDVTKWREKEGAAVSVGSFNVWKIGSLIGFCRGRSPYGENTCSFRAVFSTSHRVFYRFRLRYCLGSRAGESAFLCS